MQIEERTSPRPLRAARRALVTALVFTILGGVLLADDPEEPPKPLETGQTEEVEVTSTPVFEALDVDEFANPVTRVSEAQIEQLNAQDLAAALRRVPGVVISRYNPVGSFGGGEGGGLYIRGHGGGRPGAEITTMIDGIPKFVGVWTHPLLDTLSLDLAREVEVFKGPQPLSAGSMSFAAVNLVPKRQIREGLTQSARVAYGSFDTALARYELGARSGRFDGYVSASHRQSDGARLDADGEVSALYGRVGARLGGGFRVSLMVDFTDGWALDPGPEGAARPETPPRFENRDLMALATVSHRSGDWSGELKLYRDDGEIDWRQVENGDVFRTLTDWSNYGIKLRERRAFASGGELVLGFDQDSYGGRSRESHAEAEVDLGDFRFLSRALSLALSQPLGPSRRLIPSVGVRYHDSREFGDAWGLEAGLVWRLPRGEAYARFARGFNLPGVWSAVLYETRYARGDAWRELSPETIEHVELGLGQHVGRGARIELSAFRSDVRDGLRFVPPPPFPPSFDNIGAYKTEGFELALTSALGEKASLLVAATYTHADPDPLPYAPEWVLAAGFDATLGRRVDVHLDAEWVDDRLITNPRFGSAGRNAEAYALLSGRASLLLGGRSGRTRLYLAVENLLGEEYVYRPDYPMPGTSWTLGLDWALGQ